MDLGRFRSNTVVDKPLIGMKKLNRFKLIQFTVLCTQYLRNDLYTMFIFFQFHVFVNNHADDEIEKRGPFHMYSTYKEGFRWNAQASVVFTYDSVGCSVLIR